MIQQRKKDYLIKLIEEFSQNFNTTQSDTASELTDKIKDPDLLEQYAKLLLNKYNISDIKYIYQLHVALDIVTYIEASDNTYSWDRNILREDLLRLLDQQG